MNKSVTVLLLFTVFTVQSTLGQAFVKETEYRKFKLGLYSMYPGADFYFSTGSAEEIEMSYGLRTYAGYNVYKNLFIGINYFYESHFTDFYNGKDLVEFGVFLRYVIPYTLDVKILRRMQLYAEVGYYGTNYRYVGYDVKTVEVPERRNPIVEDYIANDDNKLNHSKWSIPVGIQFNISRLFYLDCNWQYVSFPNGADKSAWMFGAGFNLK